MAFMFATATDIRFGRGTASAAADAAICLSRRVLLVCGKNTARAAWLIDDLSAAGAFATTISCEGEPDIATVETAVATARLERPGVVMALGGGAAIDLGKAISALVPARGETLDYLEIVGKGRALDAAPLPFIAIPTTAGTGAEVTKNAVLGVPSDRRKVSLRDPRMIPDIAIVDPALTDGAPDKVTFPSGLDAVTQVIEPFLSVNASPMTDALCRDAIPRGLNALRRLAEGEDAAARDDMALTSLFGGMALANAGLGAVHGFAGVIGGRTGAPHGEICATLLPHVLAFNAGAVPPDSDAARRFNDVFAWISDALGGDASDAPRTLGGLVSALGIRKLGALGVAHDDIQEIASASQGASSSKTNPVPPDQVDFAGILRDAF